MKEPYQSVFPFPYISALGANIQPQNERFPFISTNVPVVHTCKAPAQLAVFTEVLKSQLPSIYILSDPANGGEFWTRICTLPPICVLLVPVIPTFFPAVM